MLRPMSLLSHSWQRACSELLARAVDPGLMERLLAAYAEPHRRYHSLQHLDECLASFEQVRHLAAQPAEVDMAIWFHDAVYDLQGKDNEARSADWARDALTAAGVAPAKAERVRQLVMATCHSALPVSVDEQWLVDVDLAILGAPAPRFAQYELQIRQEYAFVPEVLFRSKRREILSGFLARPHIYNTPHFRVALEHRARSNLDKAVTSG